MTPSGRFSIMTGIIAASLKVHVVAFKIDRGGNEIGSWRGEGTMWYGTCKESGDTKRSCLRYHISYGVISRKDLRTSRIMRMTAIIAARGLLVQ